MKIKKNNKEKKKIIRRIFTIVTLMLISATFVSIAKANIKYNTFNNTLSYPK